MKYRAEANSDSGLLCAQGCGRLRLGSRLRAEVTAGLRVEAAPIVGGSGLGFSGDQGSVAAQAQGSDHTGARQCRGPGAQLMVAQGSGRGAGQT